MKYLWIVILGVVYLGWTIYAIKDICSVMRDFYRELKNYHTFDIGLVDFEDATLGWIIATILVPFLISLTMFLS